MSRQGDKRATRRTRGYFPAEWETPQGRDSGMVRDLGPGGCYVESTKPVAVGWPVRIAFELTAGEVVGGLGVVVHRRASGFGVRFTRIKEEARQRIEQMLRSQSF